MAQRMNGTKTFLANRDGLTSVEFGLVVLWIVVAAVAVVAIGT
jgi:Flp pilus assembly pilin Flp